jgi:aryl sulfotransferase
MSGGIIWLASYPKSGNTWFRTFISNLLNEKHEEISINQLKTDGIFSSRPLFDHITGVEASNLTAAEIDRLRPRIYNHLARTAERTLFIKVHDAYTYLEDGTPLMGKENAKAIYILRNPLDVAVSFANHASKDLDTMVTNMGDATFASCNNKNQLANQLRQQLLTWSAHVESWAQATEIPVHLVRYEDMKLDPIPTFTKAVRFMGLDCSEEQIKKAIEMSDFKKLKAKEEVEGFKERPYKTAAFFRKGEVGDWRNHLSDAQRDRLIADHGEVMRKYGYLNEDGELVY